MRKMNLNHYSAPCISHVYITGKKLLKAHNLKDIIILAQVSEDLANGSFHGGNVFPNGQGK